MAKLRACFGAVNYIKTVINYVRRDVSVKIYEKLVAGARGMWYANVLPCDP